MFSGVTFITLAVLTTEGRPLCGGGAQKRLTGEGEVVVRQQLRIDLVAVLAVICSLTIVAIPRVPISR